MQTLQSEIREEASRFFAALRILQVVFRDISRDRWLVCFEVAIFMSHEVAEEFSRGRKPPETQHIDLKAPEGRRLFLTLSSGVALSGLLESSVVN